MIGASAGLGPHSTFALAIVELPGTSVRFSAAQFRTAANQSQAIRDLIVHYNDLFWGKFNNRLRAMRCMRWRPGFAICCCKPTTAWTAMPPFH